MKYLLGTKIGITQLIQSDGTVVAVTIIQAGPCTVTQIKEKPKKMFQIGFGVAKKLNKPQTNHLKENKLKHLREFPFDADNEETYQLGKAVDVSIFDDKEKVKVTSTSKGKGFAGVVKRHNFSIGPKSHGSKSKRAPGSTGCIYPQRKIKGKKLPGRMGNAQVTITNLKIVKIEPEKNLILIKGSVPGSNNSLVLIKQ